MTVHVPPLRRYLSTVTFAHFHSLDSFAILSFLLRAALSVSNASYIICMYYMYLRQRCDNISSGNVTLARLETTGKMECRAISRSNAVSYLWFGGKRARVIISAVGDILVIGSLFCFWCSPLCQESEMETSRVLRDSLPCFRCWSG